MSDLKFNIVVSAESAQASSRALTSDLKDTENQANKTADAGQALGDRMGQGASTAAKGVTELAGAMGGAKQSTDQFGASGEEVIGMTTRQKAMLEAIQGPMREYQENIKAVSQLLMMGKIDEQEYQDQLIKMQKATGDTTLITSEWAAALDREAQVLDRIRGPMEKYESEVAALDALMEKGRISALEYEAEFSKLAAKFGTMQGPSAGGMSTELDRETQLLQRIQSPMKQYEETLRSLNNLLDHGRISQTEYNRELERAEAAARRGSGPVQGPIRPGAEPTSGTDQIAGLQVAGQTAQQLGPTGQILGSSLMGGTMAMAGMAAGAIALSYELGGLMDQYTELVAKVTRFTESGQSANEILAQQLDLSKDLHSSLEATTELYVRVRESTMELNLTQTEQLALSKDIGEAVVASGGSAESAVALTRRLALAFSSGAVAGRELRSVMKEFPEIAQGVVDATGRTRTELLQMANKGEVSAQMLIEAFRKMEPEMQRRMKMIPETMGQTWGHVMDTLKVGWSQLAEATVDPVLQMEARRARAYLSEVDAIKQLDAAQEHNARLAPVAAAATALGLDIGGFDLQAANTQAEMKQLADTFGVVLPDAFDEARSKAQMYGAEIDKLSDSQAAKEIAEDAKRIYDSMHGGDDIVKKNLDHWKDMASTVKSVSDAIEHWKSLTPVGVPTSQEQRDLELQLKNTKTEQADFQYGKSIVSYAQGLNTARAELEALNRAAADGVIKGDDLRKKYDALMTTINDGRLPATIKLWESLTLPLRDAGDGVRAVDALFRAGRLSISEYSLEIGKAEDALYKLIAAQAQTLPGNLAQKAAPRSAFGGQAEVRYDVRDDLAAYNARLNVEAEQAEFFRTRQSQFASAQERQQHDAQAAKYGLSNDVGVQAALTAANAYQSSDSYKKLTEELNKAQVAAAAFYEPQVKYEQTLKAISEALNLNSISQEQATAAQRRAKDEYNAAEEALAATKGPLEQYEAALRKLNDQQEANNISLAKYRKGVDDARVAFLQATGAASTFKGAMEIEWIKMKQDADSFGASLAKVAVQDLDKVNDAIITAANHGAVSWTAMVDSMIQDLERLILKQLEVQALNAVIGALGGGGGAAVASGVASAADAATAADAANAAAAAAALRTATPTTGVGAYPTSGVSTVSSASTVQQSIAPKVVIVNQYDKNLPLAAMDSRQGQMQTVNALRANQAAVRSYSGMRQ